MMARGRLIVDDSVMVRCATCGTKNEPAGRFCVSCGAALSGARVATVEEPQVAIPDWVLPGRAAPRQPAPAPPPGRPFRFAILAVLWLGVFLALPTWVVWSTSPFLREVGVRDYLERIPTCAESARAAGDDPELCQDAEVRSRFELVSSQVSDERERVVKFAASAYGALLFATLILVLGAGLRPWWTFAILITPLALVVWLWALWRLSAFPVRPWQARRA